MTLSQADRRRGFRDEDAEPLVYVRHLARQRGISPDALRHHEDSYLASSGNWRSERDVEEFVRRASASLGMEQYQVDMTWDAIATTAERGEFPAISTPTPLPADDQRRLAEIQDIMRTDRPRYYRENLGDEAVDIHSRLGAEAGMSVPAPVPADAGARDARLGEIRSMMRDRSSGYFRNESIQQEYRDLLSSGGDGGSGGGQVSPSSPAAASPAEGAA